MAWTHDGPVSTPPSGLAITAGVAILLIGLVGGALGFRAAWRGGPSLTGASPEAAQDAQAIDAKPIVELPPPPAAPIAAAAPAANTVAAKAADDSDDDSNAIAAKVAQAQAAQSKPAQKQQDIDEILASPSEKPQAAAKPSTDEQAPAKSDVPF